MFYKWTGNLKSNEMRGVGPNWLYAESKEKDSNKENKKVKEDQGWKASYRGAKEPWGWEVLKTIHYDNYDIKNIEEIEAINN